MQHPKVVVIGSGSLFFGRQAIWQMVHSEHLRKGTLALVDTDPERAEKMGKLAEKVAESQGSPLRVEWSTERRDVLADADFVVLSFADRSVHFRGIDCAISEKYGVRMCSGDTIGPGGIFRTMREFPVILECCRDIEELAPDAWVINYINPTAANGLGLRRHAPKLKSFALCDGLHMPRVKINYAARAGLVKVDEDYTPEVADGFDLRIAGVNHFTWILHAEREGEDLTPVIAAAVKEAAAKETDGGDAGAKAVFNNTIGYQLYEIFGRVPCCVAHTKEYVRFWQGAGTQPEPIPPLQIWQTAPRYERHDAMWKQVDDFLSGVTPIEEYMASFGPDHATDVIETMWAGLDKEFYINTFNLGAVTNMADEAFLELRCDIDMNGPRPKPVGEFPRGLRAMQEQVLDAHELGAEAAVTCDRAVLRRAMLTDPMLSSIADADSIIAEVLEAERDALPAGWYE